MDSGVITYNLTSVHGALAQCMIMLINFLFENVQKINTPEIYPNSSHEQIIHDSSPCFDFIIVGAGAAGCSLAYYLSQVERFRVLLLEAGPIPPASSEVPAFHHTFRQSNYDWQFYLEPSKQACQTMEGRKCMLSRGRVLGGSSTINDLMYMRALSDDFDKIGVPYWNSNLTMLAYQYVERFINKREEQQYQYQYGTNGSLVLHLYNHTSWAKSAMSDIYKNKGLIEIPKRKLLGYTNLLTLTRGNLRHNLAKDFLVPLKNHSCFTLSLHSNVRSVTVREKFDKRVRYVNVTIAGNNVAIRAKKEVILTAGAINNAKILLLSGIGPKAYLERMKIKPVINVPVGKNLQFHLTVPLYFSIDVCPPDEPGCDEFHINHYYSNTFNYILNRTGHFGDVNMNEFVTYINTECTGYTVPNVAIYHKYYRKNDLVLREEMERSNFMKDVRRSILKINEQKAIITLFITLMHPASIGEVLLNETHIHSNPKIVPNFFSDEKEQDYNTLLSGWVFVTNLTTSKIAEKYKFQILEIDVPPCRNYKHCSKYYVQCYIRNMAHILPDATSTTKMGNKCDKNIVVNNELEVVGMRCLRVGDSSVLPYITSGSTLATDVMLGFRLSEILKMKWLEGYQSDFDYSEISILKKYREEG